MRQVVFCNIMSIIKSRGNQFVIEKTPSGTKYELYGMQNDRIISLYQNKNKIKLFVNDILFASESLKKTAMPFGQTYTHRQQLYKIIRALKNECIDYKIAPNFSAKCRGMYSATPKQIRALRIAWHKSYTINHEMYDTLSNNR